VYGLLIPLVVGASSAHTIATQTSSATARDQDFFCPSRRAKRSALFAEHVITEFGEAQ